MENRISLATRIILIVLLVGIFYLALNFGFGIYLQLSLQNFPVPGLVRIIILIFLILSILGIGVALALGTNLTNQLIIPLRRLILEAERIAKGEAKEIIELNQNNEFEELAKSLGKITLYLQNLQTQFSSKFIAMHEDLQRSLKEMNRQEEELLRSAKLASMGRLAASVAHEINNPLAGIRTLAKLLLEKCDEPVNQEKLEDFKKYLFLIETEAGRCGTIVKNLLAFARQDKVKFEPVDLNQVVERCLTLMDYNLKVQKIELEKQLAKELPLVKGDFSQLQQSLMAILINASEAMPRGGKLKVITGADSSLVWVKISDTGTGIPKENLPHIFEPFFTTKEKGKGLGLGLSVAYGIIQNHQGKINIQSEIGQGTIFEIIFPVLNPKGKI